MARDAQESETMGELYSSSAGSNPQTGTAGSSEEKFDEALSVCMASSEESGNAVDVPKWTTTDGRDHYRERVWRSNTYPYARNSEQCPYSGFMPLASTPYSFELGFVAVLTFHADPAYAVPSVDARVARGE